MKRHCTLLPSCFPLPFKSETTMPRFLLTGCLTLLATIAFLPQACLAEEGFRPMFNGKDLSGWVLTNTPAETWRFEEDRLVCSGKPIGEIRTAKMYQNFVMELEWRHMVPRGNAGIFVWADDITSRGVPFHRGIEVQVLENAYGNNRSHTTHGDIFPIHGATMTPINGRGGRRAFPTESRSNPSPQWNHYRIECRDGEISLAVNGKVVTRGTDCVPRKGYICLESEGGVVHYRNVRIRELPDTKVAPEHVAIANRGYRSIYNGLNLDQWTAREDADWKSKDWVLAYQGSPGKTGKLSSTETFQDAGLVVDVRLKEGESNVVIQAGASFQVDLQDKSIAGHLEKVGRWNRIEAVDRDGKQWLEINGNRLEIETSSFHSAGSLTLKPTGPVDFANLYVGQ